MQRTITLSATLVVGLFFLLALTAYADTGVSRPSPTPLMPVKVATGTQPKVPGQICPMIYAPVCGADGKTYGNECLARGSNVEIVKKGACDGSTLRDVAPPSKNTVAPVQPKPVQKEQLRVSEQQVRITVKRSVLLLDAALARAEGLIARVDSRLGKVTNVDTTAAKGALALAKTEVQAAQTSLTTVKGILNGTVTPTDPLAALRTGVVDANEHLHAAMDAIKQALDLLKSAAAAAGVNPDAR